MNSNFQIDNVKTNESISNTFANKFARWIYRKISLVYGSTLSEQQINDAVSLFAIWYTKTKQGSMRVHIHLMNDVVIIDNDPMDLTTSSIQPILQWLEDYTKSVNTPLIFTKRCNDGFILYTYGNWIFFDMVTQNITSRLKIINNNSGITVISGGAGTGKTTKACDIILQEMKINPSIKINVCAPTGQAAQNFKKRLIASTKACLDINLDDIQASTIHSLLKISNNMDYIFSYRPHDIDLLIVDESSMIGYPIFSYLLSRIPESTRIIFIGDPLQISPIEQGQPFIDIIQLTKSILPEAIIELTTRQRFGDSLKSLMEQNHRIRIDQVISASKTSDAIHAKEIGTYRQTIMDIFRLILDYYSPFIGMPEIDIVKNLSSKLAVLTPTKIGIFGTVALNKILSSMWIDWVSKNHKSTKIFRPITINKNDSQKNIYNGTKGILVQAPDQYNTKSGSIYIYIEGNMVQFDAKYIPHFDISFASTIHKSQGSEYDNIAILIPKLDEMINDALIHTAITRAKEKVFLFYDNIWAYQIKNS